MPIIEGAGRFEAAAAQARFVEQFRSADLSVGTYSLAAGAVDGQSPHTEDEVYVVTGGRAHFVDAGGWVPVGPGDTIFVPAGAEHRFVDIEEELTLVVIFGPPEDSRA